MNWQSSTLDQHSTHWPTCSCLYFSSASSLASSSCCARAFASWFPRQLGDSKVCILMRLTNRHMIKPWVYAIPSEKNANMKAPASSSSTCFSAFSAAVCCWSSCTFLLNDLQYFLGTCFHNYPAEGVQFMVSKSKCQAHFQSLVMCLSNLLLEHFFLLEKDWLTLLEIRLLLKRCEAATFTLASKV